jgi:hypothetical protein
MLHRIMLAFVIMVSATAFGARAETAEQRQACMNDAQTHCADDIPDREKVYGCLVKNVTLLSPPCKKIISSTIPAPAPARARR